MRVIVVAAVVFSFGCKRHEAQPVEVAAPPPVKPPALESEIRAKNTLSSTAKGSAFEITDAGQQFHITLPQQPTLQGDLVRQLGVQIYNAQAVMPGTDVDVQFGVMTVPEGDLPPDLSQLDQVPDQLAAATSGTVASNKPGLLAGAPAQIFELIAGDKRRLFGWYIKVPRQGRVYQINCVGQDTPATRTACAAVATSFTLAGA